MKSKMKRRMLAIVLCMVIVLSNSSFIFASSESGTPAVEAAGTEGTTSQTETDTQVTETTPQTLAVSESTPAPTDEPAAPTSVEVTPTPTDTPEVTTTPEPTGTPTPEATPTPTDTPETTTTPEPTDAPEITTTPELTDTPEATTTPESTNTPEATPTPTQGPENGTSDTAQPTATPTPTEAPVKSNEAVELKQEFKDSDGNVTSTVKAQIPEGTFAADASEITMEVQTPDTASAEHVKEMMEELLPENHMLGDYIFYDIQFKVNGTVTEPQKPITITFEGEELSVKDVKRANVFWLDPEDPQVDGDKDQLVEITQKSEMIENLQNSGQSTENIDDYDLSEITLKEDGTSDKIQMEGRTSTIYGCYVVYEPVQVLTYDDDQVTVTVSAAEEGIIPANAELKVVPITAEDKNTENQYKEVEQKLQEKAKEDEYDIAGFLAYDITFVDKDGNETEPGGEVKVSIDYKEAAIPEAISEEDAANAEVTVLHLEEDEKGEVKEVVDMAQDEKVDVLATTEENKVEKVEVRTESFSTFTITWGHGRSSSEVNVTFIDKQGEILTIKNEEEYDISLESGDTFYFSSITENATGQYKKYYSITDVNGKNYTFSEAVNVWGTYPQDDGSEVTAIRYTSKYGIQWRGAGSNWNRDSRDTFYVVYSEAKKESGPLSTVETVDTSDLITMRMIDYDSAANGLDDELGGQYSGPVKQNLVKRVLGSDGYPVISNSSQSLKNLFSESAENSVPVNKLFLKSTFDETGYYEYSSFENYAYLNQNQNKELKEFTVYNQIGTPVKDNSSFYFKRGNFLPYSAIQDGVYADYGNLYNENGGDLDPNDPRYNEVLYLADEDQETSDKFYFGMYLEADFAQLKDGQVKNKTTNQLSDMVYEFNGDDDLWVYIDDVLVLDIGGEHDAHSGTINFASGAVHIELGGNNVQDTTIKDLFWEARRFPDGSLWNNWNDSKVEQFFDGNTFSDYTNHTMKMFYMERGAGASNLHMKFNLEVIPKGEVQVRKELAPESDPVKFGDVNFGFKLYVEKQNSEGEGTGELEQITSFEEYNYNATKQSSDGIISTLEMEEGKFYLQPGEVAYINNIPVNLKYEVEEVDVQSDYFDKIEISGTQIKEDFSGEESNISYGLSSGQDTVDHRPMVTFINSCNAKNLRTLTIEKKMETGQNSDAMFTMHVELENSNGDLAPFNGSYHLRNENEQTIDADGNIQRDNTLRLTTTDGNISIKAGWTISIYSILSDTDFSVTETLGTDQQGEYKTPVYMMTEDDDNQLKEVEKATGTIQLNANAKVQVINGYKSILTVEKQWACITENALPDYIYIGLYKKENADNVNPIKYQKLLAVEDWRTSFTGLEANGEYLVKELVVTSGSGEFEIDGQQYVGVDSGETVSFNGIKFTVDYSPTTIQLTNDSNLITITNTQAWQIVKRSTSEPHPELPGAKFQLEKLDKSGQMTKSIFNGTSDDNGIIQWDNRITPLENGTYLLKETKAPDGYSCGGEWRIVIENGLPKTIEGTLGTDDTATPIGGPTFTCYLNDGVVTVYYDNTPLYNLPSAGSSGIFGYTMGGTLLLMAGTLILYKMKRKEVLGS